MTASADNILGLIEFIKRILVFLLVNFDDALGDKLVVVDVLIFGGVFFGGEVVLDGEVVLVLHEVAEGSVEVEEFIEVGAEGVFFGHFVEVVNSLVYFSFHEENHALGE